LYLVGGFNHLEKYEFVNGKDDIPYMKWKIKAMFQTTNQIRYQYGGSLKWEVPPNHAFKWDFPLYTNHFEVPPFMDSPHTI